MSGKVWETGRPLIIDDYQSWGGHAAVYKSYPFTTVMGVPIQLSQEFLGVLNVVNRPTPFSPGDVELLSLFATQAAIAIRNAQLVDSLQESEQSYKKLFAIERRQAQELYLLEQVRAALAAELDLPAILRTIVETIAKTFGYTQVSIYLLEGGVSVLQHQVGYHRVLDRIPITEGISGQVVRTGQPILVKDVRIHPDFLGAIEGLNSEICVPLFDQGQVVGFFNIESSQEVTLDEADLRLMIALSEQINLAIGRARLYNEAKESAERFRQLAENIQDVFWMTDLAGTETIYVSPAYGEMWGRPLSSIYERPRSWLEAVHREDRARVEAYFDSQERTNGPTLKEYRLVQPDGAVRWVRERSFPVLNESGEVYRVAGIVEDITQRRQTEEALRQSEERFRGLFEGSPIPLWEEDFSAVKAYLDQLRAEGVTDFEAYFAQHPEEVSYCGALVKFIDANQAALKLDQVNTKAELASLFQQIIQNTPKSFTRELLTIAAGKTKLETEQFTNVINPAEAHHVIINWSVMPSYEENYAQVLVGVFDITNRKRAEQALQESEQRYRELAQQNAALYTESQKRLAEQTALLRATTVISSSLDLATVLKSLAEQIGLAVDATSAYICSYEAETKTSKILAEYFSPHASAAEQVSDLGVVYSIPRDLPAVFNFIQSDKPTQAQHVDDPDLPEAERYHLQQFGACSTLLFRLQVSHQLLGYAALWESRRRREFTVDEIALCQGIAQQAAIAIQNARLLEQARHDAETKAILLKEVNHRVKNNLTTIIGLLYAERRHQNHTGQPANFNEIIRNLINRVHGLSTVHSLLSATEWSPLALSELAHQVVTSTLQSLASDRQVVVEVPSSAVLVTPQQANNLALIINELTTNAIKYGLRDNEPFQITINVRQEDKLILFEFRNSGPGYPPEVLSLERHSVGMYLIQNLVHKGLYGQINLHNEGGAVATICFPASLPLRGKV
ncbi:MAG: GAF domain-containing protein [Anaerolineales bacterium]|nr:GAF domain-containing protein [Anaerolineales bacterium]